MKRLITIVSGVAILVAAGCKERLAPHVTPEPDPQLLVEQSIAADNAARAANQAHTAQAKQITLTINNAPRADQSLEYEILQQMVELFQKRHPNIKIEFSPWQFTPESFFERVRNRTLTDIVEVECSQLPLILDSNYAADLTELASSAPELRDLNPALMDHLIRKGRIFGVPVEAHTMALFYNRPLVEAALHPPAEEKNTGDKSGSRQSGQDSDSTQMQGKKSPKPPRDKKSGTEEKKGKGADGEPRDYLTDGMLFNAPPESLMERYTLSKGGDGEKAPRLLAQYQPGYYGNPQAQGYYPPQPGGYYQQPPPQQQRPRRGFRNWFGRRQEDPYGQQPQPYAPQPPPQAPSHYDPYDPESPTYQRPMPDELYNTQQTPAPRQRNRDEQAETEEAGEERRTIDEDVLSTDPVEQTTATKSEARLTTYVETAGMPEDWDSFIRLASKLTDHSTTPTYGYAPVLFAREGGREFAQWAIQAGLQVQVLSGDTATLDVNTTSAAMVAQFLKDLHWRYDVTPPPGESYADNLMRMFAQGRVAMMMLPADHETITRLLKLGMSVEDFGIAPLPGGPANRKHLMFGRCLIVNSQLGSEERSAAFKWLLFQMDPEVIRMRKMAAFREQDWTGAPHVPLYTPARHDELVESLRPYYTLPIFPHYMRTVATNLALEPPLFTDRLYEAIAEGVRPIVENKSSDPMQGIQYVGTDFEKKYLKSGSDPEGIRKYLKLIPGL